MRNKILGIVFPVLAATVFAFIGEKLVPGTLNDIIIVLMLCMYAVATFVLLK